MDLAGALAYLDGHVNREATAGRVEGLSLDRMRRLVAALGDPQGDYPAIHVTGTNGKGSTVRIASTLLRAHGLSVGTYTSPHLDRINERIVWDGQPIGDDDLAAVIADVARAASSLPDEAELSYFELLTAAALRWFADVAVEVAVVEVGLLGRWDATNVIDGTVAVVTNVGRDHTDGAPGWREAVAREKAGIVEPGAALVLGETEPSLWPIFEETGAEPLWRRDRDFGCVANQLAVGGRLLDLRTPGASYDEVYLPLHGSHQGENAAMALAAVEVFLGRAVAEDVVEEAFAGLTVPGRFEVLRHQPLLVLDGAHNPDGAAALAATLEEGFAVSGQRWFVVGMLAGRDPLEILRALGVGQGDRVLACTPDSPRALPPSSVPDAARALGAEARAVPSVEEALAVSIEGASADDAVIVAGSLYVVGPARAWCRQAGLLATP